MKKWEKEQKRKKEERDRLLVALSVASEDVLLRHDKHGDHDAYRVGIARIQILAQELLKLELL